MKYLYGSLDSPNQFLGFRAIGWPFQAIVDLAKALRCGQFFKSRSETSEVDHQILVDRLQSQRAYFLEKAQAITYSRSIVNGRMFLENCTAVLTLYELAELF